MPEKYEAIVIGSGFGGAITACRMSKKWPGRVMVIERGKRYPMGSFPRRPHEMARNFWNIPGEGRTRPKRMQEEEQHGMFDVRNYKRMDAVLGAGLGGGSLVYANVFLMPPDEVFQDERWPASSKKQKLMPYYEVAKEVLGSRPIPQNGDPRRRILRTELFQKVAQRNGRDSQLVDINVFFGNDSDTPTPIGHQQRNRYGALQTSCVYCAECDVGCNYHSKNTLDLNYLFVAEKRYDAEILTEHLAEKIVPVNEQGQDDPGGNGAHGYRVYYSDLSKDPHQEKSALAHRVVVSGGSLGSTELLLRCKEVFRTLPLISDRIGQQFSGNGDFLGFVVDTDEPADPNYGPVITQRTDYNLFADFDRKRAFILEDASYPSFLAWFTEGVKPGYLRLGAIGRAARHWFHRFLRGMATGSVGYALRDLLSGDVSWNSGVLLCMGIDKSNGTLTLDESGKIDLHWPQKDSMPLYEAIVRAGKDFEKAAQAKEYVPLPTWLWPFRNNVTVHALGGCVLADGPSQGVTSADPASFGQVFGYQGLYVADGAILPAAVGANPTATISSLSEMVAEGITGEPPDADL